MPNNILRKSLDLLLKRQTNILSAAYIIMVTVLLSYILGLVKLRLLGSIFGPSNVLGVYLAATRFPDFLFQIVIASALYSAFIPVFSEYLAKDNEKEAYNMASTLLTVGLLIFLGLSIIFSIFAPFFLQFFNLGSGFSSSQMVLMTNIVRIVIIGQILFIVGTFLTALLQSYNHFLIPGIAAALYNLGIIIGTVTLSKSIGIYAPVVGIILGGIFFVVVQIPLARHIGFRYKPDISLKHLGVKKVGMLMWPRTISVAVAQIGTLLTLTFVSFLPSSGRNYVILDFAQTLAFAAVALFGQSIAQAAFPVLSREKDSPDAFKLTFMTSFSQMLYIVLPISVIILVLRIPIVRLVYGAQGFDWDATVLTGRTLAFFSFSIFAQALIALITRAFYALQNTFTPLIVGVISTVVMLLLSWGSILIFKSGMQRLVWPYNLFHGLFRGEFIISFGIEGLAFAYSIATIINLLILLYLLRKRVGKFSVPDFVLPIIKIFVSAFLTAFALYIPIKLLDRLIFDTSRTIPLIILTGISGAIGLSLYLFLTWFFNVKEAKTYIQIIGRLGNWRDILGKSDEIIEGPKI